MQTENEICELGSVSAETRGADQAGLEEIATGYKIFPRGIQPED